jgi:hypothetical protein
MLDWLTVVELAAAALVVLGVLSVIAHFVNQARAKANAADSGNTPALEQPSPVATPEPRADTLAADAASPVAVVAPRAAVVSSQAADAVLLPSESLLPVVEPILAASDAAPPAVERAIPPASKGVSARFRRFAKPPAVPAARLKNALPLKTARWPKIKRRPKRGNATNERRRTSFAPATKAKPALTRRPKRVTQVRPKKTTPPVRRSGKAVVHRSPRPVLTRT